MPLKEERLVTVTGRMCVGNWIYVHRVYWIIDDVFPAPFQTAFAYYYLLL